MDAIALQAKILSQNTLLLFLKLPVLTQWAVTSMLVVGLIIHVFAYNERTAHDAPSIFTTAGIFFTFVGIAEGLLGFSATNIEASVPSLLDGLQTAFIASVVGVGIALTIKLRYTLFGVRRQSTAAPAQGATVDDLFNQMVAVQQSLVGEDDSTLLSQIKLSRQDTNDRLDSLRKSQAEFMEKMADNNSKALIQALQEVIRDFNTKISEQFGENFKRLNEAVGQLLVWQENYRVQLEEMIKQQTEASKNMETATTRYGELVAKAETFSSISSQLATLLSSLNEQRGQIEASIKSLGELLLAASGSLPQVETKIMELTTQMTEGVKNNQMEITKTLRDSSQVLQGTVGEIKKLLIEGTQSTHQDVNAHFKQLGEKMAQNVQSNQAEIIKAIRESSIAIQSTVSDAKKLLLEATQSNNQEVNAHFKQLGEKTTEQLAKLDIALEKELTKALQTLGSQLTSLSAQFVTDYGPLTANLREIVQAARR